MQHLGPEGRVQRVTRSCQLGGAHPASARVWATRRCAGEGVAWFGGSCVAVFPDLAVSPGKCTIHMVLKRSFGYRAQVGRCRRFIYIKCVQGFVWHAMTSPSAIALFGPVTGSRFVHFPGKTASTRTWTIIEMPGERPHGRSVPSRAVPPACRARTASHRTAIIGTLHDHPACPAR